MRLLIALALVAACGGSSGYKLAAIEPYEVGEEPTIAVEISKRTQAEAHLIITRPDGTWVRQPAPLDTATSKVRFGHPPRPRVPPTFTAAGTYHVELKEGQKLLAESEIVIKTDRLNELLPEEDIADYQPIIRQVKPRQSGKARWKTYSAIYELPWKKDVDIEVIVEEPKAALDEAWELYEDEGAVSAIEGNNVILRERPDSVLLAWIAKERIVVMRAPTLKELQQGLIAHFFKKFPSTLAGQ